MSINKKSHDFLTNNIKEGDYTIDATVGNGKDTTFLAQIVGISGKVYGFDIQQLAIERTQELLRENNLHQQVELILDSHHNLKQHIPLKHQGKIQAAMFNLGYLPAGDRDIITNLTTTIPALQATVDLLQQGGILTITAYTKHDGGPQEWQAIQEWLANLSTTQFAIHYEIPKPNDRRAPKLVLITKL